MVEATAQRRHALQQPRLDRRGRQESSAVAPMSWSAGARYSPGMRSSALRRALNVLYMIGAALGGLSLIGVLSLMLLQVLFRELGLVLRGADDLTAWSCAAAVFLPLAHTFKRGELVRMGLVLDGLTGVARRRMELLALAVAGSFLAYATYWAVTLSYESWLIDDRAQGMLPVPMWIPQLSMAVGLLIFLIAVLDELVLTLSGASPSYAVASRDRQQKPDFSGEL